MPLRDHFHKPLIDTYGWSSFHSNWSVKMVDQLNATRLTARFLAVSERHGSKVEIDVATLERQEDELSFSGTNGREEGGVARLLETEVYAPPAPPLSERVTFSSEDLLEVRIYRDGGAWNLVAAIELVSEANKDRDESRGTFAIKCASYLQSGVSVVVVDAVTSRSAELHNDLCDLLEVDDAMRWSSPTGLSATAYRVVRNEKKVRLDAWPVPLTIGEPLPTLPLWLAANLAVPLELELTYEAACKSLRIR